MMEFTDILASIHAAAETAYRGYMYAVLAVGVVYLVRGIAYCVTYRDSQKWY